MALTSTTSSSSKPRKTNRTTRRKPRIASTNDHNIEVKVEPSDDEHSVQDNRNVHGNVGHSVGGGVALEQSSSISTVYNQNEPSVIVPNQTSIISSNSANEPPVVETTHKSVETTENNNKDEGNIESSQMELEANDILAGDVNVEYPLGDYEALEQPTNSTISLNGLSVNESNQDEIVSPASNVDSSVQSTPFQLYQFKEEPDDMDASTVSHINTESDQIEPPPAESPSPPPLHLLDPLGTVTLPFGYHPDCVCDMCVDFKWFHDQMVTKYILPPTENPLEEDPNASGDQQQQQLQLPVFDNEVNDGSNEVPLPELSNSVPGNRQLLPQVVDHEANDRTNEVPLQEPPNSAIADGKLPPQVFDHEANDGTNEVPLPELSNSATGDGQLQPQDSNGVVTCNDYEVPLQHPSLDASTNEQPNTDSSEQALSPSFDDSDEDGMPSEDDLPLQERQDDSQMQVDSQTLSQHNRVTTRSATNSQTASSNEIDIHSLAGPSGQTSSNAISPTNNSSQILTLKTGDGLFFCPLKDCTVSENSEQALREHLKKVHHPKFGLGVLNKIELVPAMPIYHDLNGKRVDVMLLQQQLQSRTSVQVYVSYISVDSRGAMGSTILNQPVEIHEIDLEAIAYSNNQTLSKANSPTATDESGTNLGRSCRMTEPKGSYVYENEDDENDKESEFAPSDTEEYENDVDDDYDEEEEEEQQQVMPSRHVKRMQSESTPSVTSENEDDIQEEDVISAKIPRLSKTQRADNESESELSNQSTTKAHLNEISKTEKKNDPNRNALPNRKKHYEILSLNCIKCDKVIKDDEDIEEALNDHLERVHSYKRNRCYAKGCEELSFNNKHEVTNHRRDVHKNATELLCAQCLNVLKTFKGLYLHYYAYHIEGQYKCLAKNCDFIGKHRDETHTHYRERHSIQKCDYCTYHDIKVNLRKHFYAVHDDNTNKTP